MCVGGEDRNTPCAASIRAFRRHCTDVVSNRCVHAFRSVRGSLPKPHAPLQGDFLEIVFWLCLRNHGRADLRVGHGRDGARPSLRCFRQVGNNQNNFQLQLPSTRSLTRLRSFAKLGLQLVLSLGAGELART